MSEEQEPTANASNDQNEQQKEPSLPFGIPLPKPIPKEGSSVDKWKRFKRVWDNYAVVARLHKFDEDFKTATFLSAIGEDALEIYDGFTFNPSSDSRRLQEVIKKFEEFYVGETNETYERYVFNSRIQKEGESFDQYLSALRNLAKTCNFCTCLKDTLLRDKIVLGVKDNTLRRKMLQDRKLTLAKAIDICRSGESASAKLKDLPGNSADFSEIHDISTSTRAGTSNRGSWNARAGRSKRGSEETHRVCRYCGKQHEFSKDKCPAFGKTCKNCGIKNHFAAVCKQKKKPINAMTNDNSSNSGDSLFTLQLEPEIEDINMLRKPQASTKIKASMKIRGGKEVPFQLDTGASCNVIKLSDLKNTKYANRIKKTDQILRMYNLSVVKPVGICKVQLSNPKDKRKYKVNFTVIDNDNCMNLLGSRTSQQMDLIKVQYDHFQTQNLVHSEHTAEAHSLGKTRKNEMNLDDLSTQYQDVFEGLGNLGPELHLEVDKSVKPVQQPARRIPEAMKQPLKEHLEELEARGIISKEERPTEWVNSIVIARKANGNIRLCLDPRPLNKALKRSHYQMPTLEDILPQLGDVKIFTKLDCKEGFWQIPLDEESSLLTTFATPFGRYRWNRMPFGIAPASEEFQRRLSQGVEGLKGIFVVADDILLAGSGEDREKAILDHDDNLVALMNRCRERQIKLNKDKTVFKQPSVPFIGHLLTNQGVQADPAKTEAIKSMESPSDVAGVQRIMGTVNYMAKFLPKLSEVSEPIRQLTKNDVVFTWDQPQKQAFEKIKEMLTSSPVLKYYEANKELVMQCDASQGGLGAALLQDGRPIAYASRSLSSAERNYAQIEKELLAIVYGAKRFHQYTFGRHVLVESDHKPLEAILAKPISEAPKRLQRMILGLQSYDLTISYKKGKEMLIADTLSRHYTRPPGPKHSEEGARSQFEEEIERSVQIHEINQLLVTEEETEIYQQETNDDEVLQAVKSVVQSGWPEDKRHLPATVAPYFNIRDELTVCDGLLFKGDRLVIPWSLRKKIVKELHSSHQGVESTLRRARETIYWPNMKSDLQDIIQKCEICATFSTKQQKETLISHDSPDRPWSKIAADLFEYKKKDYMVTVDYYSNFFELDRIYDTSSSTVIKKLKMHIARYGIPDKFMSDNGPQFTSQEFQNFGKEYGFEHITSSPYHHQSNGKVESAVKQAKRILKTSTLSGSDPHMALLNIRNTPQEGFDSSPAERLMSRRTKTALPSTDCLLKPRVVENVHERDRFRKLKQKIKYDKGAKDLKELEEDDQIRMQPFRLGEKTWKKGKVLRKLGIRSYEVESDGQVYIRNRRHLRFSPEEPEATQEDPAPNESSLNETVEGAPIHGSESPSANELEPPSTPAAKQSEQVRTRSGRISKRPAYLQDFVES